MKTIILMGCLFLSIHSFAFTQSTLENSRIGNGGDVVDYRGETRFLDLVERHESLGREYFDPEINLNIHYNMEKTTRLVAKLKDFKINKMNISKLEVHEIIYILTSFHESNVLESFIAKIGDDEQGYGPIFGNHIFRTGIRGIINRCAFPSYNISQQLEALGQLTNSKGSNSLVWFFVYTPLENVKDEGLVRLYSNNKRQLAIQKDGYVAINKNEFDKLPNLDKAVFFIHELLIGVISKRNTDYFTEHSTQNLRKYIKTFIEYFFEEKYIPYRVLVDACEKI